jgi:hypothetical protein
MRDGDDILMSTLGHTVKAHNLRRDPRANVCLYEPGKGVNSYTIYGTVTISEEGGEDLCVALSRKYVPRRPDPVGYLRRKTDRRGPWLVLRLTPRQIHEHH